MIILLIVFFSSINRLIHWDSLNSFADIFPYFVLLIPTFVIAKGFKAVDAKVLVLLVAIESIAVILQWYFNVSTFDSSLAGFTEFEQGASAYFQRPLGWSDSSSHVASKLLLSWMMIDFFKFKNKLWWLVKLLLLFAIVFTFNRSVILSLGVYIIIYYGVGFLNLRFKLENAVVGLYAAIFSSLAIAFVAIFKWESILNQFTRNTGTVELTGREYLWSDFILFIQDHLIFGNNSIKLWLDGYHAHNAYIEVIATNGIFIAILYFILIYRNIRSNNWVYVVPVLVYGLTQYGFFWGISLMDILFYVILFTGCTQIKTESIFLKAEPTL